MAVTTISAIAVLGGLSLAGITTVSFYIHKQVRIHSLANAAHLTDFIEQVEKQSELDITSVDDHRELARLLSEHERNLNREELFRLAEHHRNIRLISKLAYQQRRIDIRGRDNDLH